MIHILFLLLLVVLGQFLHYDYRLDLRDVILSDHDCDYLSDASRFSLFDALHASVFLLP